MKKIRLIIFCKTNKKGSDKNPYHAGGLAANALHTIGVLKRHDVNCEMQLVNNYDDVVAFLAHNHDVTHVIVEAVWMTLDQVQTLAVRHFDVQFVVRAHSKIGFLQCEPEAIPIMRQIIDSKMHNVTFASNNSEFADALYEVYGKVLHLPNLYDLNESPAKWEGKAHTLHIASFGATRLLKMHPNAALAALQISQRTGRPLMFFINTDSTPGGESVRAAIRNLFAGLDQGSRPCHLVEVNWQDPIAFKKTIAAMDLVLQLSSTETFCLVAADAVASGVPVVVGPAITWISKEYQAAIDDTSDVASAGTRALANSSSVAKAQLRQLNKFLKDSTNSWLTFLELPKKSWWSF